MANVPDFLLDKKRKKPKTNKKRNPVCWRRDAAGRRQTHTRGMVPSRSMFRAGLRRLIRGVAGTLLGGQELASEEAKYRSRELTDLKRRRLPELALPTLLSVSLARCSVVSFSSWIHLRESKTRHLPLSAQERVWTTNLGWHSASR